MTWIAVPVSPREVTATSLFDISKQHRLLPDDVSLAIDYFKSVCDNCAVIRVVDEESEEEIGVLIITSIVDGNTADVDFIPHPQFFSPDANYREDISAALSPVFAKLMEGRGLRRLTSMVPKSRSRTKHALIACGFKKEGVMRNAVKFAKRDAEDVVILGMIPEKE